jgi:hypothetical protein
VRHGSLDFLSNTHLEKIASVASEIIMPYKNEI